MSIDDAETARRCLSAFNQRDKAAWIALCDPEIENFPPRGWPEAAATQGVEAVWDFLVELQEDWDNADHEWREMIDAGNGTIIGHQQAALQGRTSGAPVVFSYWLVISLRGGKPVRLEWFSDRAEAFETAGLST